MKKLMTILVTAILFSTASHAQIGQPPVDSLCAIEIQDTITFHVKYGLILYASHFMQNSDELTAAIAQATEKTTDTAQTVEVTITEQLVVDILYTLGNVQERTGADPNKALKAVLLPMLVHRPCLATKLTTFLTDNSHDYNAWICDEKKKIDKVRKYLSNN